MCGWGIHPGKWGSTRSPCKTSRFPPCFQLGIFVRVPAAFLACFLTCRARRQEASLDVVELHEHGTRHARTTQQHLHPAHTRTVFRQQHTPKGPAPQPTRGFAACDTPDCRELHGTCRRSTALPDATSSRTTLRANVDFPAPGSPQRSIMQPLPRSTIGANWGKSEIYYLA